MSEKTPYSRSEESNSREISMRKELAPLVLKNLGKIISDRKVRGMQMVTVQPLSGPPLVAWVKCAWKPGNSGNCAVQMAFPGKEDRAHTADDVVNVVVEKTKRALELNPNDARALALGAGGYQKLGDKASGLAWLQRAQAVSPNSSNVMYNSACFHALAGDSEIALDYLEKAAE